MTMQGVLIALATVSVVTLVGWQATGLLIAWKLLSSDHHKFQSQQTPAERGVKAETLIIPVDESHHLAGWILRPLPRTSRGGACVIMVHGFDSGKDKVWVFPDDDGYRASTLDQGAMTLWEAGFHVVAIDLRNHGESSDNGLVTLGARESEDVLATVDYLSRNAIRLGIDPTRIGLRGESMGGATCLIAAGKDNANRIAAVWSDSAYCDARTAILDFMPYKGIPRLFGLPARFWLVKITGVDLIESSPSHFVERIHCPVLLTHSHGDSMLPIRHLDRLASAAGWRHEPERWPLESHQHNRLWREPGYQQRQIDFFVRHLDQEQSCRKAA